MSAADATILIPATHPSLPGHFPGRPIVPGVLLLAHVAAALNAAYGPLVVRGARQVKFLAPLFPDVACAVFFTNIQTRSAEFTCRVDANIVARGSIVFDPLAGAQ